PTVLVCCASHVGAHLCPSQPHPQPPHLHSFPTRRSSDLPTSPHSVKMCPCPPPSMRINPWNSRKKPKVPWSHPKNPPPRSSAGRSEEHTSELQSRENLVCRLLLEKKKIHRASVGRQVAVL